MPNPDARGVAPAPPEPKLIRRENGGWLAVSPPGVQPSIGVVGWAAEDAKNAFARAWREWQQLLGISTECAECARVADHLEAVIEALQAENATLLSALSAARDRADQAERALQPFAQQGVADYWGDDVSVSGMVGLNVTAGDFRTARRALTSASPDPTDRTDK